MGSGSKHRLQSILRDSRENEIVTEPGLRIALGPGSDQAANWPQLGSLMEQCS